MPKTKTIPTNKKIPLVTALNEKQTLFVQAYVAGQSPFDAACHAGYSQQNAKSTARRLLQNPDIQAALQSLKPIDDKNHPPKNCKNDEQYHEEHSDECKDESITPEAVVRELAAIGFTSMNDICTWSEDGVYLRHSDDIPVMANAAIAEIRESGTARGGVLVKLHSKLRALEMLGRHLGMFSSQVTSNQGVHDSMAFEAAQALFDDKDNALPEAILQKLNAVYGHSKQFPRPSLNTIKTCNTSEDNNYSSQEDDFNDENSEHENFETDDFNETYDQISAFT